MKERIFAALKANWKVVCAIVVCALSLLMTLQEIGLGNPSTAWAIGSCVAVGFSAVIELFRSIMCGDGFEWRNVVLLAVAGAFGVGVGYMI